MYTPTEFKAMINGERGLESQADAEQHLEHMLGLWAAEIATIPTPQGLLELPPEQARQALFGEVAF